MFHYYWDPTYILVLIGVVLSLAASSLVKNTYYKYARNVSVSGMTGRDVAERILRMNGVQGVTIRRVAGELTDHYDPRNQTVNLSEAVYDSCSVAAIGVAAHECGHVLQHENGYVPIKIRGALVPVANFGSQIAWPLILIGFLINGYTSSMFFVNLGIILFSAAVLFQIVTLPVEFNASGRALRILGDTGVLGTEEVRDTRKVLSAAALTYVAGAAAAILQLLRLLILFGGRNDD